ncbi:PAS domain S-box protein [Sphingomonas arenae]|uniref:PAS domain S-box protein n=1 Tax=Sphingomonas arenae TaxID=2812555 RepID=UPI0019680D59|nr:PAS domain S-box protein [Sphingomonas arenae]
MQRVDLVDEPSSIDGDLPFRLLADHLPALCFMADGGGRVRWCNRRWYDYTGALPGADPHEIWPSLHDPTLLDEIQARWDASIRSGEAGEMVVLLRGADARFRPFLTRAEPVKAPDGSVRCWLGTMTEIGEQREAEQNQRFLVQLGDALRDKSDPAEILFVTGRQLGTHLGLRRVGYGEVEEDGNTVIAGGRGWQPTDEPAVTEMLSLDSFGRGMADQLRRGEVSVIADTLIDPMTHGAAEVQSAYDIRASVTVPLIKNGRLAAVLYAQDSSPRAWRDAEVQLIREVAERTWATLERASAETARSESEQRLRESEARLRAIVDATPECVKLVAPDGSLDHMNAAGLRMLEADTDADALGRDIVKVIAPEHRARWRENHKRVCAGESLVWEFDVIGLKGTRRHMETHAVPLADAHGRMQQLAVTRDISTRKATEAALAESEARFRGVIETAHEGIWLVDREARTLFANQRMADLLGTTREEMQQRSVPDYSFAEDLEDTRQRIGNNLSGNPEQFEFRFRRTDGTPLPVLAATAPLRDGEGNIVGAVGMFSDLTERKQAEEKLRESEALLAAFMKHAPIGMYLKDADGRYLMLNPEMAKVFDRPLEEVVGESAAELFGPEEAAMIAEFDREILASGRSRRVEEHLPGRDDYEWSLVVRFPLALDEEKSTRIGGFDIDISDRKRAEAELQRSREALYQSEKLTALGSLLAGVSHELNNPLSVVLTLSELLEQKASGTPFSERAAKIHAAAARCGKIVQTFLAMARQRAPVRQSVSVNALVSGALELTAYSLRTGGVQIVQELAESLPLIEADADQLGQVLVNLLVNAQHALLERDTQRVLTIRTSADERSRRVRVEVEDNGPGVAPEIRRRIFDPFFTSKPQGQGTGIGLTFSLGIVEAHGGTLRLDDPPDGGARFTIELPARGEAMPAPGNGNERTAESASGRALVIDDEPDLGDALAEMLADEGYRVDVVRSGEDAKKMIALHDYDAVLSDLRMPGVDGPSLLDWLEDEHPYLVRRLAFVTGDTLGPTAARFLDRARRPFLEKPFDLSGLRRILAELGEGRHG